MQNSMVFVRTLGKEIRKTGLKIDQPDPKGGSTSTGGVTRRAFSSESKFIDCVSSCVAIEYKETLSELHTPLSAAILRINKFRQEDTYRRIWRSMHGHISFFSTRFLGQALLRHCIGY